ncbi:ABC transporter permease [Okibacterium endophyticum]
MSAEERYDALRQQPLVQVGSSDGRVGNSWTALREIIRHRQMLGLLVRRDIRSRYKDSSLGLVWTLVRPLTQLAIFYFVIGKILGAERGIPEFAIYVYTGLTAYGLFSEIVGGGTSSIVANAGLIKKVYLPREVFPLASIGSAGFSFLIQLAILLVATIVFGSAPLSPDLVYFVPSLLLLVVWGAAFAVLLSAVNVYLRDMQYLVEVAILLLMWASPIVYSWEMVKNIAGNNLLLLEVYTNNPITLGVLGFQRVFWMAGHDNPASSPPDLMIRIGVALVVGLIGLFFAQRVFARLQGNFAQEL